MKQKTIKFMLLSLTIFNVIALSGCGENQATPTSSVSSAANNEITVKEDTAVQIAKKDLSKITTDLNPNVSVKVGKTTFIIPKPWENTVTPGSTVSFNITTSSEQNKVLGIAQVSSNQTQITENLLQQTADGIKMATPELANSSVSTAVISPQQGIITIIRNGIVYQGWVISNEKGTYLLTLAPGYTPEKKGIPLNKTQSPKLIIVEGTATEQVQAIVNLWLSSSS